MITKGKFNELSILTVYNLYNYATLIHIAKLIILKEPVILCNLMKLSISDLRSNRIFLPSLKLTHYQNNFCYLGPKLWNLLCSSPSYCSSITMAPSLTSLKSRLKRLLNEMQIYGEESEWLSMNNCLELYLTSIKSDPYNSLPES